MVPLFSSTDLSKLPARILRFRLWLMRYSPVVKYVLGKTHYTTDALSRAPIGKPTKEDLVLLEEVEIQNNQALQSIPVTDRHLLELKECQGKMQCVHKSKIMSRVAGLLSCHISLFLSHTGITSSTLPPMMACLCSTHRLWSLSLFSWTSLIRYAKAIWESPNVKDVHSTFWWPGITVQVESMCKNCLLCSLNQSERKEPLLPTSPPGNVWERVGTYLFYFNKKDYIAVTDYSSRWLDFKELPSITSRDIIIALSEIFATIGAPTVLVSDNGPQYAAEEFKLFATDWGFTHVPTSPWYPQTNGATEQAVQMAKIILKKNSNPYLGLLAYRTEPIHNGFTPSQLLMSRLLRITLPTIPEVLKPSPVNKEITGQKEEEYRERYSKDFDNWHRVISLPCLSPGDKV